MCLPGIGIDAEMALNAHFCCEHCSRKFFVKHALKKHMETEHGIEGAEVAATHNLSFLADELKDKLPPDVLDKLPLEVPFSDFTEKLVLSFLLQIYFKLSMFIHKCVFSLTTG